MVADGAVQSAVGVGEGLRGSVRTDQTISPLFVGDTSYHQEEGSPVIPLGELTHSGTVKAGKSSDIVDFFPCAYYAHYF